MPTVCSQLFSKQMLSEIVFKKIDIQHVEKIWFDEKTQTCTVLIDQKLIHTLLSIFGQKYFRLFKIAESLFYAKIDESQMSDNDKTSIMENLFIYNFSNLDI